MKKSFHVSEGDRCSQIQDGGVCGDVEEIPLVEVKAPRMSV